MNTIKKIVRLRLYHFQSHVDSIIDFDPVSNAIKGKTDAGKSVLTRALFWVLYNKPTRIGHKGKSDEFTTWGQSHCFVSVLFDDGTEITRGRNKGENYYQLKTKEGGAKEFKGFGFEVPQEVADAHGMYLIAEDDSRSLNVSQQLDPLFMFEEGSSKRAKTLGRLSGADRMDGAISIINSWNRGASDSKKDCVAKINELNSKLEEYAFLDDLNTSIKVLADLILSISDKENLQRELVTELKLLTELNLKRQELVCFASFEFNLVTTSAFIVGLRELLGKREFLKDLYERYETTKTEANAVYLLIDKTTALNTVADFIDTLTTKLAVYNSIKVPFNDYVKLEEELKTTSVFLALADKADEADALIKHLRTLISKFNEILEVHALSTKVRASVANGTLFISNKEKELSVLLDDYEKALKESKVCPLCKSSLGPDTISNIIYT